MVMEILRNGFVNERDYIMANVFFYHVIAESWEKGKNPESYAKKTTAFLGDILDGVRRALTPTVSRSRLIRLINLHFPDLMNYIRQELEIQGQNVNDIHVNENTKIDLFFFIESLKFYKVINLNNFDS